MGMKFIRIPLLMFWPESFSSDIHKTSEDSNYLINENQCKNNDLFARHASNGPNVEFWKERRH